MLPYPSFASERLGGGVVAEDTSSLCWDRGEPRGPRGPPGVRQLRGPCRGARARFHSRGSHRRGPEGMHPAHPVVRLSVWKHWRGVRGTTGTAPCGNAVLHAGNTSTFLGRSELVAVVSGGAVAKRSSCGNLPTRSWGLLLRLLLQR